jgi:hypothetical protein
VNQDTVQAGIKAVKTRKARYALFKVVNDPNGVMEITIDKQADRKASKEESVFFFINQIHFWQYNCIHLSQSLTFGFDLFDYYYVYFSLDSSRISSDYLHSPNDN